MKVGFIGLGLMGSSMALNVRAAGHDLVVTDLRRAAGDPHVEAGCRWADGARQVGQAAEVVFTSLPGPKEVETVSEALQVGMRPGTAWFDLSTNSPTVMRRIADRFAPKGIAVLDAPVSGGPAGAKSRKLALWVGGERAVYDRHKALLDAIADEPMHIGPVGAGSVAKLTHNMAGYALMGVLAEVFSVGVKAGIDPLALWTAVRQGAMGRKRVFDRLAEQYLPGSYDPAAFALTLGVKDAVLATELGRELNVPMRIANLTLAEMTDALNRGWGERDTRCFMLLQSERAGVEISVAEAALQEVLKGG
ncbi:MAG: NAD(P)-dependent oxidoreductase [Burkholderiales bacterium]|nr:NAD(P)-dependent oxidoreductase [Burkholderiales bacterium]